jgi:alpha-beta hydrolase superfamily lysophospholipase
VAQFHWAPRTGADLRLLWRAAGGFRSREMSTVVGCLRSLESAVPAPTERWWALRASRLKKVTIGVLIGVTVSANSNASVDGGLPRRPSLGVNLAETPAGPAVSAVVRGSAAEVAGLRSGDVIRSINGKPASSTADVVAGVRQSGANRPVQLVIGGSYGERRIKIVVPEARRERGEGFKTVYGAVSVRSALQRTLLTLPSANVGKSPVLLIVDGIGCFSVDVAGDPADAYQSLAHDLARAGIATLRVEKSGIGDSQGPACAQTDFHHETEAYTAALKALRAERRVDPGRIYLFGHSIGSVIAPALTADSPVRGVIVAEAVGRNWFEYELANLRRQLELGGDSAAQVDEALARKERCMHRLLIDGEDERQIESREPDCKTPNSYPASAEYMRQAAAQNVARLWEQMPQVPVLAIYGDADIVTDPADHRRIVDIVRARGGEADLVIIHGMDHHLRHAGSISAAYLAFEAGKESSFAYEKSLSDTIADWLKSDGGRSSGAH